jgi:hypothetical protein
MLSGRLVASPGRIILLAIDSRVGPWVTSTEKVETLVQRQRIDTRWEQSRKVRFPNPLVVISP